MLSICCCTIWAFVQNAASKKINCRVVFYSTAFVTANAPNKPPNDFYYKINEKRCDRTEPKKRLVETDLLKNVFY